MQKLTEIIDRILDKHGNLLGPTLDEVFEIVMADKSLCRDLFGDIFRMQIERMIRHRFSQQRDSICNAPDSAICGDPGKLAAEETPKSESRPSPIYLSGMKIAYQKSLLDFPLSDGKRVRDAIKDDIEKQYLIYRTQSATGIINALWMRAILNKLPDDKTPVGDVLDDFSIKNLWNMANKEFDSKLPQYKRHAIGGKK